MTPIDDSVATRMGRPRELTESEKKLKDLNQRICTYAHESKLLASEVAELRTLLGQLVEKLTDKKAPEESDTLAKVAEKFCNAVDEAMKTGGARFSDAWHGSVEEVTNHYNNGQATFKDRITYLPRWKKELVADINKLLPQLDTVAKIYQILELPTLSAPDKAERLKPLIKSLEGIEDNVKCIDKDALIESASWGFHLP